MAPPKNTPRAQEAREENETGPARSENAAPDS